MSINKLERTLWRLRKTRPGEKRFTWRELKIAIMKEIGTSPETLRRTKKALIMLGWIKPHRKTKLELTEKDLE